MNFINLVCSKLQNGVHDVCVTTKHIFEWDNVFNTGQVNHMTRLTRRGYKTACTVVIGDFWHFPAVTNFHTVVFKSDWSVIVTFTREDLLLLGR
jgi:hypothetical protein